MKEKAGEIYVPVCKKMISAEVVSWLHREQPQQWVWNAAICITSTAGIIILG